MTYTHDYEVENMIKYANDYEVKAFVTNLGRYNEGELIGEWVVFPIDEDEQQELFERIGIDEEHEEIFITDYDSELPLYEEFGEYPSLEELNELAEEIEAMNGQDIKKMLAIKEYTGGTMLECINDLCNYELYEDMEPAEYMQQLFEDIEYEFMRALNGSWFSGYVDIDWDGMFQCEDYAHETEYGILREC